VKMYFFGDSICFGQHVSPYKNWVTRLSELLEKRLKVSVNNPSINGNTTRMALERMPQDIQKYHVDVLLIQFGLNDCNYWETDSGLPRVSKAAFHANLLEIIERARIFGAKKIFLNTNHLCLRELPHAPIPFKESVLAYNQIIHDVAKQSKVILNDIEKYITSQIEQKKCDLNDLLLDDGVHLSEEGHNLYFEFLSTILLNELKEEK